MSGAHASRAPSGAPIWGHCSGYLALLHVVVDRETDETRAGTASHWCVPESVLNEYEPEELIGQTDPDGTVIDEGMAEGARHMVEMIQQDLAADPDAELLLEHRVYMPDIHPDNWGTADYTLIVRRRKHIIVGDYKHGHRVVPIEGNLQLIDYLKGVVNYLGLTYEDLADWTFELKICQPYAYSPSGTVKRWPCTLADVSPLWAQLKRQAHAEPHMTVGGHCRDCPAVGRCDAARRAGYSVIDYTGEPFVIDDMTGAELAAERQVLETGAKLLAARLEDIEEQLMQRIKRGETDSGLAIKGTHGREKWQGGDAVAVAALQTLGLDISSPKAITPNQAEKAAKTKEQRDAIAALRFRPGGKLVLVNAADKPAAKAFTKRD